MKGMTTEEKRLIEELFKPNSLMDIFNKSGKKKLEIIHSLSNSRSLYLLTLLLPFALDKNESILSAARSAIKQIIQRHLNKGLISLDQYLRRLTQFQDMERLKRWHHLSPETVSDYTICSEADLLFLGICSFHRNGHVREAAIERLSQEYSGYEIPFLIIRLNDWLPKIRFMAYKAIKQRITVDYAQHFLQAIYLIRHLSEYYNREKFTELLYEIYELFKKPECSSSIFNGLTSNDPEVLRFSFNFALKLPDIDLSTVVTKARNQADALIRLDTLKHLCNFMSNNELLPWLDLFKADAFPPIRQLVLQTFVDRFPENRSKELMAALLDCHKAIRELARYYLKEQEIDYPFYYREKLSDSDDNMLSAALAGIGETGKTEDAQWVVPYLQHERARVSRAAVKAVALLDQENNIDVFIDLLQSEKPSVSREAREVLSNMIDLRHATILWDIFLKDARHYVRRNILFLFSQLGKTDNILYLLRACAVDDEEIREFAVQHVEFWTYGYNRWFYAPLSHEKCDELSEILNEVKQFIREATVEELKFLIRKNRR